MNSPFPLWQRLRESKLPILLYGTGDGADKICSACADFGVQVAGFFASDGFVRKRLFRGQRVMSYTEVKEKYDDFIVLLAFGTSLPDLLDLMRGLAANHEFYAPDLPIVNNSPVFTAEFYEQHRKDFAEARNLFADRESRLLFDEVLAYKLSGKISYLERTITKEQLWQRLRPQNYRTCVDLGAYNGDTVLDMLHYCGGVEKIFAIEPDEKNFGKLVSYAENVSPCIVHAINAAVWDCEAVLPFAHNGNRSSRHQPSVGTVRGATLDSIICGEGVDFIKYDVEGAEERALLGSKNTIAAHSPDLLVAAYHRSDDLFRLPKLIHSLNPNYRLYLYRHDCLPGWDLNIVATETLPDLLLQ